MRGVTAASNRDTTLRRPARDRDLDQAEFDAVRRSLPERGEHPWVILRRGGSPRPGLEIKAKLADLKALRAVPRQRFFGAHAPVAGQPLSQPFPVVVLYPPHVVRAPCWRDPGAASSLPEPREWRAHAPLLRLIMPGPAYTPAAPAQNDSSDARSDVSPGVPDISRAALKSGRRQTPPPPDCGSRPASSTLPREGRSFRMRRSGGIVMGAQHIQSPNFAARNPAASSKRKSDRPNQRRLGDRLCRRNHSMRPLLLFLCCLACTAASLAGGTGCIDQTIARLRSQTPSRPPKTGDRGRRFLPSLPIPQIPARNTPGHCSIVRTGNAKTAKEAVEAPREGVSRESGVSRNPRHCCFESINDAGTFERCRSHPGQSERYEKAIELDPSGRNLMSAWAAFISWPRLRGRQLQRRRKSRPDSSSRSPRAGANCSAVLSSQTSTPTGQVGNWSREQYQLAEKPPGADGLRLCIRHGAASTRKGPAAALVVLEKYQGRRVTPMMPPGT